MKTLFKDEQSKLFSPHPLKEEFRKRNVPLWFISKYTGISEPKLSRYFNLIDEMPLNLQDKLHQLIDHLTVNVEPGVDQKAAVNEIRNFINFVRNKDE